MIQLKRKQDELVLQKAELEYEIDRKEKELENYKNRVTLLEIDIEEIEQSLKGWLC